MVFRSDNGNYNDRMNFEKRTDKEKSENNPNIRYYSLHIYKNAMDFASKKDETKINCQMEN